jgi:hypothetical protein
MADIDSFSDELGIPWEHAKDIPFSPVITYIGFRWDIEARTVSIPETKKTKYLIAIAAWKARRTHTLEDAQQLHGKLMHACHVVPMGRAYLTSLESFLGIFHDCPFLPRTPPKHIQADLNWWEALFRRTRIERPIPGPSVVFNIAAYSDASSETGIGIVIGDRWRAWRLLPEWKSDGRDIGWAEALGFYLLVATIFTSCDHKPFYKVYGDNRGVIEGWWKGCSRNRPTNEVFKLVHIACLHSHLQIITRYVQSKHNPADDPSRGIYQARNLLLPAVPIPQQWQLFITDFDAPYSLSEQCAARLGTSPHSLPKPPRDPAYLLAVDAQDLANAHIAEKTLTQAQSWR